MIIYSFCLEMTAKCIINLIIIDITELFAKT